MNLYALVVFPSRWKVGGMGGKWRKHGAHDAEIVLIELEMLPRRRAHT